MKAPQDAGGRTPADQLEALGHPGTRGWSEDSPRWHLQAAEQAVEDGRLTVARGAVERARESTVPGSPDADEAAFVALRVAVAMVDLRGAAEEVMGLRDRMDPGDPVWKGRVRHIVERAPAAFGASMRAGILSLVPETSPTRASPRDAEADAIPYVAVPESGLPALPGEPTPAETPGADGRPPEREVPPVQLHDPFAPGSPGGEYPPFIVWEEAEGERGESFSGRILVTGDETDLTDAALLRDRLVREMLAGVSEREGRLLFDAAATFLINREYRSALEMFSAAMAVPELRVAACEGMMQALVGGGHYADAITTARKALRIMAHEGDALLGIVYWSGVASAELGDHSGACRAFGRIATSPHAGDFPDLSTRLAALGR